MIELTSCIRVLADLEQINRCRIDLNSAQNQIRSKSDLFNLIGSEVRLSILFALRQEEKLCVCDLSDILGISIPAVSQQLRKLKDGGLIKSEKMGQTIYNFIQPGKAKQLAIFLSSIEPELST